MARTTRQPGENPLIWIGSSKSDLMEFPSAVIYEIGSALGEAQFGGKSLNAKPWKGEGSGVLEIVDDYRGDTYRAVYTIRFENAVYVLHAFQKKSTRGHKTSLSDVWLIHQRLREAREDYQARHDKTKK